MTKTVRQSKGNSINLAQRLFILDVNKLVCAIGGQQSVPDDLKLLGIKSKTDKNFFLSDEVVKKNGFFKLLHYIKENNVKEISIIGGSHSGLS